MLHGECYIVSIFLGELLSEADKLLPKNICNRSGSIPQRSLTPRQTIPVNIYKYSTLRAYVFIHHSPFNIHHSGRVFTARLRRELQRAWAAACSSLCIPLSERFSPFTRFVKATHSMLCLNEGAARCALTFAQFKTRSGSSACALAQRFEEDYAASHPHLE